MRLKITFVTVCVALGSPSAFAKDVPIQARVFIGSTKVDPKNMNTELEAQSLKKIDDLPQYGVEILYPIARFLDAGLRYSRRSIVRDEILASSATNYEAELNQDTVFALARIPFLRTSIVRLDAFAGFGGSNTTLKIRTATQDGEISKKDTTGWLASPYSIFGGSVGLGYKRFYFVVEGGMETNKVEKLNRTGSVNGNITEIDLSGSYFMVGLMFDGVAMSKK